MKLLRETICQIILENIEDFEKIAGLLCSRDPISVTQAAEIAQGKKYITSFSYGGPRPTNWNENLYNHSWILDGVHEGLSAAIEKEWKIREPNDSDDHSMYPTLSLDNVQRWMIEIQAHEY